MSPYCATCMAYLPRPSLAYLDGNRRTADHRMVDDFSQALHDRAEGYAIVDEFLVDWALYAVTYVGGTALCHAHGVLAHRRAMEQAREQELAAPTLQEQDEALRAELSPHPYSEHKGRGCNCCGRPRWDRIHRDR